MKRHVSASVAYTALVLAWAGAVSAMVLWKGFVQTQFALGVPAQRRPFGDLRQLLQAIDLARGGSSQYFFQHLEYHRSWLALKYVGIGAAHTYAAGVLLGLAFLIHLGMLAASDAEHPLTGVVLAGFACSPPVMLLLERGNADLLLYLLLALACHLVARRPTLLSQAAAAALIFLTGVLKYVPFAACPALLVSDAPVRRRWLVMFGVIAAALLFLFVESAEVSRAIVQPDRHRAVGWMDFGSIVSATLATQLASRMVSSGVASRLTPVLQWLGLVATAAFAARHVVRLRRGRMTSTFAHVASDAGFAAAAPMFIASFVLLPSYNYKLAFLALAVPALCRWARHASAVGATSRLTLVCLLLWMWSGVEHHVYVLANIVLPWIIVGAMTSLLIVLELERTGIAAWTPAAAPSPTTIS